MAQEDQDLSVSEIRAMVDKEELHWTPGETPLSALSLEEKKKYLGLKVTKAELKSAAEETKRLADLEVRRFEAGASYGAPAVKDWRDVSGKSYVTRVKDQGGCGSCVSFGSCATIESNIRIKSQNPELDIDLSEAFMQFCGGGSCSGWGLTSGLEFAKSTGVTDEACFPYEPKNMPCENRCDNWQSRLVKINDFTPHASMQERKDAIANKGPVLAGMAVYSDFFSYASGVYQKTSGASLSGYHAISVVGYDDNQQCWIIKNSWGPGWGEGGFCHMAYGQADLLIDSNWSFYTVESAVEPEKGSGQAKHLLVDKRFGGGVILWAHAGGKWRHKAIKDADLAGFVQEAFAADRVDVWWDKNQITLVRAWKNH